jgi:hypothetical protein
MRSVFNEGSSFDAFFKNSLLLEIILSLTSHSVLNPCVQPISTVLFVVFSLTIVYPL